LRRRYLPQAWVAALIDNDLLGLLFFRYNAVIFTSSLFQLFGFQGYFGVLISRFCIDRGGFFILVKIYFSKGLQVSNVRTYI